MCEVGDKELEGRMGDKRKKKADQGRNGDGKRRVRIGSETGKTTLGNTVRFGNTSSVRDTAIYEKSQTKPKDESKSKK